MRPCGVARESSQGHNGFIHSHRKENLHNLAARLLLEIVGFK